MDRQRFGEANLGAEERFVVGVVEDGFVANRGGGGIRSGVIVGDVGLSFLVVLRVEEKREICVNTMMDDG